MGVYLRGKSWYIDFYYEGKRYTEKVGKGAKSVAEDKLDIKRSEVICGEWKPKKIQISFDKFKEEYLELTRGDKSLNPHCGMNAHQTSFQDLRWEAAIRDQPFVD